MNTSNIKILLLAFALCMITSLPACGNNVNTDHTTSQPSETPNAGMSDNYESNPDNSAPLLPKDIIIESKDINDTLEITIEFEDEHGLSSFNSNDIEKIVIPESDDDGYYEVQFWLTSDAILKADAVVSYISDFPVDISIDGKTFEFFIRDNVLYHYSRTFSSVSEGLKGFDCPLLESKITREDFEILFAK